MLEFLKASKLRGYAKDRCPQRVELAPPPWLPGHPQGTAMAAKAGQGDMSDNWMAVLCLRHE